MRGVAFGCRCPKPSPKLPSFRACYRRSHRRLLLSRLEKACRGRTFAQRRDAAIIAVFKATGIRVSELPGIRYNASDPRRSDVDLWNREITVRGKAGRARIGYDTARAPGPAHSRSGPARAGVAAAAVAGHQ
jgi:site-specific recombinase XerC